MFLDTSSGTQFTKKNRSTALKPEGDHLNSSSILPAATHSRRDSLKEHFLEQRRQSPVLPATELKMMMATTQHNQGAGAFQMNIKDVKQPTMFKHNLLTTTKYERENIDQVLDVLGRFYDDEKKR